MPLISRLAFFFLLVALCFPLVATTSVGSRSCKKNEFWYAAKNSCLPHGGPSRIPDPPKGQECPPTGYYWGSRQGCCVPRHPPPVDSPLPQCRKGWQWFPSLHMCLPKPTPPTPHPPHPSGNYHGRHRDDDRPRRGAVGSQNQNGVTKGHSKYTHSRRSLRKARSLPLCPGGLDACPITGQGAGDYECIDVATELRSCGGCPALGQGQDCTAIPGAFNVGCESGSCAVYTCAPGFKRSDDRKSCLPL